MAVESQVLEDLGVAKKQLMDMLAGGGQWKELQHNYSPIKLFEREGGDPQKALLRMESQLNVDPSWPSIRAFCEDYRFLHNVIITFIRNREDPDYAPIKVINESEEHGYKVYRIQCPLPYPLSHRDFVFATCCEQLDDGRLIVYGCNVKIPEVKGYVRAELVFVGVVLTPACNGYCDLTYFFQIGFGASLPGWMLRKLNSNLPIIVRELRNHFQKVMFQRDGELERPTLQLKAPSTPMVLLISELSTLAGIAGIFMWLLPFKLQVSFALLIVGLIGMWNHRDKVFLSLVPRPITRAVCERSIESLATDGKALVEASKWAWRSIKSSEPEVAAPCSAKREVIDFFSEDLKRMLVTEESLEQREEYIKEKKKSEEKAREEREREEEEARKIQKPGRISRTVSMATSASSGLAIIFAGATILGVSLFRNRERIKGFIGK